MEAISSSPCRHIPPSGGKRSIMFVKIVVAGVIGYPAKKRHPDAIAPRTIASFPSIRQRGISLSP
jgi:hypothetical protein